jgi:anti-sigma regulatory factor (Ser/Thr protein kinase)
MEIWCDAKEIVCEIRDSGVITDPLVGQRPPAPGANGGHGLWLVYQICDQVELHSDENGTTVRLHMSLPPA